MAPGWAACKEGPGSAVSTCSHEGNLWSAFKPLEFFGLDVIKQCFKREPTVSLCLQWWSSTMMATAKTSLPEAWQLDVTYRLHLHKIPHLSPPSLSVSLARLKRSYYSNRTKSYSITARGYWLYSKLNNYVAGLQWQMCTRPHFKGVCCQQRRVIPLQLQTGREAAATYLLNHTIKVRSRETVIEKRKCSTGFHLPISTSHMSHVGSPLIHVKMDSRVINEGEHID